MTKPSNPVADAACEYVAAGWHLTQIAAGQKIPTHKEWNTRAKAITTPAQVRARITGNVGLLAAFCGMAVVDVDNGTIAMPWFAERGIDLQALVDADDAVLILSGRENRCKLLYRLPPGVEPLRTYVPCEGLELRCISSRGTSFQDVLPPSIHPVTGKPYVWCGNWKNVPVMPAALLTVWQSLSVRNSNIDTGPVSADLDDVQTLLDVIDPSPLEYDQWLSVGMALHHQTGGSIDGLKLWDRWSSRSTDHVDGTAEYKYESFHSDVDHPVTVHTIEKLAQRHLIRHVEDLTAAAAEATAVEDAKPPKFKFVPDHEAMNRRPLTWWNKGRLAKGWRVVVVYGPWGSGKTFVIYDWLATIAQGRDFCGRKSRKARVAWIVAEGAVGFANRKMAYATKNGGALPGFIELYAAPNIMQKADIRDVARGVEAAGGCDLLVIDTLSATTPGSDELTEHMGVILANAKAIGEALDCTVILVHHPGKDVTKGPRGSYKLSGDADAQILIEEGPQHRTMTFQKVKDGEQGEVITFQLVPVQLGIDQDGDPITSCVVEYIEQAAPTVRPQARGRMPTSQGKVLEVIQELTPLAGGPVDLTLVYETARKSFPCIPGKRDTRNQKIQASLKALHGKGLVNFTDTTCCLT